MLISVCITERCESYSHNSEGISLSTFDHNTEQRIFNKVLRSLRFWRTRCKVLLGQTVLLARETCSGSCTSMF